MPLLPADNAVPLPPRAVELIVVHCSATASGKRIGSNLRGITAAHVIDGWHAQRGFHRAATCVTCYSSALGFIGYHWVIDLDGSIQRGRHPREVGAHVAGHNAKSLGICLVGGAEPDARYTVAQWDALRRLVDELQQRWPQARVVGHRDLSPDADGDGRVERHEWLKTCPGFDVAAWLQAGRMPLAQQVVAVR
jgi:hypothetical protein